MDVIVFPIAGGKDRAEVAGDFGEDFSKPLYRCGIEHTASVFGHKDQIHMKRRYDMPACAILHLAPSWTKCDNAIMETIRGFVYTLYPTAEQREALARTAGVVRLVYNLALEQRRTWSGRPYKGGPSRSFSAMGLSGELSELRKSFDWIGAVSQTTQNQALIDLDRAFSNFFEGRARYPRPRKKGRDDAFRHVGREVSVRKLNARWSEVKVPKIGWIRYRDTRPLPSPGNNSGENPRRPDIRSATLRAVPGGGWQISIAVRFEIAERPAPNAAIGVDRGVAIPFALSTGEMVHLPKTMARREATMRRAQKTLSRRKRGSRRHAKAQRRLARLKASNARARMDLAHRLTRRLACEAGLVAIEDLKIGNMTASARGTIEEPGRNVRQKAGLNRAILNVGWHAFERLLAYKLEESGGVLTKVRPHYTSQECATCGHVDKESRKSQAAFVCTACGASANADINAARTILARALSGEEIRRMNTTSLDAEASTSVACEASTLLAMARFNAGIMATGNPRPSGRGRC